MNITLLILTGIIIILIIAEVSLRQFFGFGNPLLYIADTQIGYLLAPSQQTRRFGNQIIINRYSMRSLEITPTRPEATLRILMLGDSIANGGWWTDQHNILSALLQCQLQSEIAATRYQHIEVLNASANSWAPRNELAYLQKFGTFDAQIILQIINTDDLFGTAPSSVVVGRDRNYPDRKPPFAITEVITRYVTKPKPIPELEAVQKEGGDRVGLNLEAIGQIQTIATQTNAQFLLALTPLLREIGEPGSRDYETKARHRLSQFTQDRQIPFIDFLPIFNPIANPSTLYRDHIHLSSKGNRQVVQSLVGKVRDSLKDEA
ncbi:MAG: SGNH/GDSL hydrolase family protein [Cyanobacteria bacterium CRU_2_1]|nr:SGNH/GDSL hydrolase family protein [Cyanobacteria bacterium RU_5_0]NJR59954.1 SGNH/GDSL hydrolase family protein [Cyanobacteria bacterium CRU_2_1]